MLDSRTLARECQRAVVLNAAAAQGSAAVNAAVACAECADIDLDCARTDARGSDRHGNFQLQRHTRRDRMRAALQKVKQTLRKRWHWKIPEQGKWLGQVVRGYFGYHAVPTNFRRIDAFRHFVVDLWRRALKRRSQKDNMTWQRIERLAEDWIPAPRILHPWPNTRFLVNHPRQVPVA